MVPSEPKNRGAQSTERKFEEIRNMKRERGAQVLYSETNGNIFETSFNPANKAGTLVFIVSEHFKSSHLCSYLHSHSSVAHIFVPVPWLSILLVGSPEESS